MKPQMYIIYGDEKIIFECLPRHSNINRVLIKVHPDCRVIVLAPKDTEGQAVLVAVKKRARWIYEKLREFRVQNQYAFPKKYVSGESHYYLGKRYMLKIIENSNVPPYVKLLRGKLEISICKKNTDQIQILLFDWYKIKAREIFAKRLSAVLEQTLWIKNPPLMRLLAMKTQWGSCSPRGRLTLNPHLIKAPRECIDYVILHELCHIAEHNHSKRFYRLMHQVMPTWEKTKKHLDEMACVWIY